MVIINIEVLKKIIEKVPKDFEFEFDDGALIHFFYRFCV